MSMSGDGYTRFVSWLKIFLPLAALGLLSTVFLLSETQEVRQDLPFADVDLDETGLRERLVKPMFSGASAQGDLIAFVAETARPEGEGLGVVSADQVRARIDLVSGGVVTFQSNAARMEDPKGLAQLSGDVVITSSTGYRVATEVLSAGMDRVYAETDGEVRGDGPPGRFVAGKMLLSTNDEGGDVRLRFTDGVKLVYLPASD